jgi:prepilin-type N-terminal cleavage/methylation domain-containing protein
MRNNEHGFSLVELMVVMAITSVLVTLGAFAVRNFWLVRSLSGGQDEIASQMRAVQAKVMAESNPLIYGVGFREGTNEWQIVRYRAAVGTTPASCVGDGTRRFDAGVVISDVNFSTSLAGQSVGGMVTLCQSVAGMSTVPNDGFVFFLPRGMATSGTVTIRQPNLGRTATVEVFALSGRVRQL